MLESQQFFEGAICPAVGDYTGIMSQVLSSTMLLIGVMITVYNHKLKINIFLLLSKVIFRLLSLERGTFQKLRPCN